MKKKIEIINLGILILILAITLIPMTEASLLQTKNYDDGNREYKIRDYAGTGKFLGIGNNFDIRLVKNTDTCEKYCYAEMDITFYNDFKADSKELFFTDFFDIKEDAKELNHNYQIWGEVEYDCIKSYKKAMVSNGSMHEIPEYGKCTREDWRYFEPSEYNFKKGITYRIRLNGIKEADKSIEWISEIDGARLDKWEWWNPADYSTSYADYPDFYESGDRTANGTSNPPNGSTMQDIGGWVGTGGIYLSEVGGNPLATPYEGTRLMSQFVGTSINRIINRNNLTNSTLDYWMYDNGTIRNTNCILKLCHDGSNESLGDNPIASIGINEGAGAEYQNNYSVRDVGAGTYNNLLKRSQGWHHFIIHWSNGQMNFSVDDNLQTYTLNNMLYQNVSGLSFYCDANKNEFAWDLMMLYNGTTIPTGPASRVIQVTAPENKTYNMTTPIHLKVTTKQDVTWRYSLNGAANVTFTPNTTITGTERSNNLFIFATNSSGVTNETNINFTIDTIAPNVSIQSPNLSIYTTANVTLDYHVRDVNWNGTWIVINAGTNKSINKHNSSFVVVNRTAYVTICANDSAQNVGCNTTTTDTAGMMEITYTTTIDEFAETNYEINVTCNTSRISINDKMFIFNGTNYSVSITTFNESFYTIKKSNFIIPSVAGSGSVNVPISFNATLYKDVLTYLVKQNKSASQTINIMDFDNCSSYGHLIYNFLYKDENEANKIVPIDNTTYTTFEGLFSIGYIPYNTKNFTIKYQKENKTNWSICSNYANQTKNISAQILYSSKNYAGEENDDNRNRFYILNEKIVAGGTNISIYLVNSSKVYNYPSPIRNKIIVRNEYEKAISDVYVKILKFYDGNNSWKNITWGKDYTDSDGESMAWLQENGNYKFEFWQDYSLLDTQTAIVTATDLLFIITPTQKFNIVGASRDINYTLHWSNTTNITTFTFISKVGGKAEINNTCLKIYKRSALDKEETSCDNCSTQGSESGTLTCDLGKTDGYYTAIASGSITNNAGKKDEETISFILAALDIKKGVTGAYDILGTEGIFIALIIFSILTMLGIYAPQVAVLFGAVGFALASIMGVIDIGYGSIIIIVTIGFVIMIKIWGNRTQ